MITVSYTEESKNCEEWKGFYNGILSLYTISTSQNPIRLERAEPSEQNLRDGIWRQLEYIDFVLADSDSFLSQ